MWFFVTATSEGVFFTCPCTVASQRERQQTAEESLNRALERERELAAEVRALPSCVVFGCTHRCLWWSFDCCFV
jgi:hypothetical protein